MTEKKNTNPVGGYASVTKGEKIAYALSTIACFASLIAMMFGFAYRWNFYIMLTLGTIAGLGFLFVLVFGLAIEGEETFNAITKGSLKGDRYDGE